jgi:hypothetical protein
MTAIKKYGSEGKMGPWKYHWKTQYYFKKINEVKIWINNQLSEFKMKIK